MASGEERRTDATMKNLEGKAKEALGDVTGDPQQEAEGKLKQNEAQRKHEEQNIKDEMKEQVDKA